MSVSADIFYLLVYIDDIILISSDSTILQCLIQLMSSEFKLRDLGDVHYFLGIEVQSTSMGRCYDNISILSASLLGLIWSLANLLILLFLPPKLQCCLIPYFLILQVFIKSLVLFNILHLRDHTYVLLLKEFVIYACSYRFSLGCH
jgi:hypothetical protein